MKSKKFYIILSCMLVPAILQAGSSLLGFGQGRIGAYQYPYSVSALGRGGTSMAFTDSLALNQNNFALWSVLSRSTISLGLGYENLTSKSDYGDISSGDANFRGGFIALPLIQRKLAVGIGIIPLARNEFAVTIADISPSSQAVQTLRTTGTISEAKFVVSYAVNTSLAFAVTGNYNFGLIKDESEITYSEPGFGDITTENRYQLYGFGFGFHALYKINQDLAVGFRIKLPSEQTLTTTQISSGFEEDAETIRDISFPLRWAAGLSYMIGNNWQGALDFDYQGWGSGYKIEDQPVPGMNNSFRLGAGIERMSDKRRFATYGQSVTYRAGLFYGRLNVESNESAVDEYGLSLGIGLPISKLRNRFDIALEVGQRGSLDTNLISETFIRLGFSISTNELWFVREER